MNERPVPMPRAAQALCDDQEGIITRAQLIAGGLTRSATARRVDSGRWRPVFPGVYATFTGPLPDRARVWAAILTAGEGAAASHETALWLDGLRTVSPPLWDVSVPASGRVVSRPGLRIHHRRGLEKIVHPAARPPRVRLDASVLDVADATDSEQVVMGLVFETTQRRFSSAARLRAELRSRPRHRWRHLLDEILADVDAGAASPLERRYLTHVERLHRLPHGVRNAPETDPEGRRRYRDIRYRRWRLVVELDGRGAHPTAAAFRDWRRDNALVLEGDAALRYGWHDVVGRPCDVALQVARALRLRGWNGEARPCSQACPSALVNARP